MYSAHHNLSGEERKQEKTNLSLHTNIPMLHHQFAFITKGKQAEKKACVWTIQKIPFLGDK